VNNNVDFVYFHVHIDYDLFDECSDDALLEADVGPRIVPDSIEIAGQCSQ